MTFYEEPHPRAIVTRALSYDNDSTWIIPPLHDAIHAFTGVLDYRKATRYRRHDAVISLPTTYG